MVERGRQGRQLGLYVPVETAEKLGDTIRAELAYSHGANVHTSRWRQPMAV